MNNFDQLQAMYLVVKLGGFSRAAQQLRLSQSAISQRITALENSVGRPLLVRSTPPTPTATGQRYIATFEQMQALFHRLDERNQTSTQDITLSLACNVESHVLWFSRCQIEAALDLGILINLHLEDQTRTHLLLKDGTVLGCVSSVAGPFQGCTTHRLGMQVYRCVAHRNFVERHALIRNIAAKIVNVPTVTYGLHDAIHDQFLCKILKVKTPPPYLTHFVPSIPGMIQHVDLGAAYAVLPNAMIAHEIESGKWIDLFPKQSISVPLYWHTVDTDIPLLKAVTDRVLLASRQMLRAPL